MQWFSQLVNFPRIHLKLLQLHAYRYVSLEPEASDIVACRHCESGQRWRPRLQWQKWLSGYFSCLSNWEYDRGVLLIIPTKPQGLS